MAKKVLVVDDSPVDLNNLKSILTDAGCIVVTAVNGAEAIAKAKSEKPQIIFLDIVMPDMDGFNACRELSGDPSTAGIPVVFVSSKNQKADQAWGLMQGAKGYVCKPYTADQVIDQLKAAA